MALIARKYAGQSFLRHLIEAAVEMYPHLTTTTGTSHGAYKFSRKPTGDILAIERIKPIPLDTMADRYDKGEIRAVVN